MKKNLEDIFGEITINSNKENFSIYEIEFNYDNISRLHSVLNDDNYQKINEVLLNYGYKWELTIGDYSYSISQDSFEGFTEETDNNEVIIKFNIHKIGNKIVIFDQKIFESFLNSIKLNSLLSIFNDKKFPLYFFESFSDVSFINNKIAYNNSTEEVKELLNKVNISNQCNFRNYSEFYFSPDFFYSLENDNKTLLQRYFSNLSLLYCLVFIFNSTEIIDDKIILSISGDRTFKYTLDFKDLDIDLLPVYHKIYKWIYSEESKKEDKIGIARNVLTSYLKEDSIEITDSVFNSILSCNQIYIKGNISKYFEVRNKITEQIEQTINKVNQSIDTFFNNFQKSIFVFISFYLSVFIFKVINNKSSLENIFNKETSLLGMGLIVLSVIFLLFSIYIVCLEKSRVKERYDNVKKRYEDVLIEEDINKILRNDEEYNKEIKFLNYRICLYTCLWITTLLIFIIVLFLASDYLELSLFLINCK